MSVRLPPVSRPHQPALAPVVIAKTLTVEAGEQFGVAAIGRREPHLFARPNPVSARQTAATSGLLSPPQRQRTSQRRQVAQRGQADGRLSRPHAPHIVQYGLLTIAWLAVTGQQGHRPRYGRGVFFTEPAGQITRQGQRQVVPAALRPEPRRLRGRGDHGGQYLEALAVDLRRLALTEPSLGLSILLDGRWEHRLRALRREALAGRCRFVL